MKEQFVTYEIALKLKELGFDEECLAYWFKYEYKSAIEELMWEEIPVYDYNSKDSKYISAPLWQQIIDYLREKHDINIIIAKNSKEIIEYVKSKDSSIDINSRLFCWYFVDHSPKGTATTYYEAREQAILKAIELIS